MDKLVTRGSLSRMMQRWRKNKPQKVFKNKGDSSPYCSFALLLTWEKLSKGKCRALHLGRNHPRPQCVLGQRGGSVVEKDPGGLPSGARASELPSWARRQMVCWAASGNVWPRGGGQRACPAAPRWPAVCPRARGIPGLGLAKPPRKQQTGRFKRATACRCATTKPSS